MSYWRWLGRMIWRRTKRYVEGTIQNIRDDKREIWLYVGLLSTLATAVIPGTMAAIHSDPWILSFSLLLPIPLLLTIGYAVYCGEMDSMEASK